MKIKLILIAILGLIFSNPIFSQSKHLNTYNPEEKVYWDFLKERLFDGERSIVSSFQEDILIHLNGASALDSSIVENLMFELRQIITNRKVRFSKENIEVDENGDIIHSINIGFNDAGTIGSNEYIHRSKSINGNQIYYTGFKGIYQDDIYQQNINIKFNDSISFANRKRYIEYAIIKSMCTIKGSDKDARTFVENAILSDFDYNPVNTKFSEVDKFVIQKLYSNDFQKQFKNYMLANSSWRYSQVFRHKNIMETIGYFISIIIALLILLFSYNPVIGRNYRNLYFSYLFPGFLVTNSALFIISVFQYLATHFIVFHWSKLYELLFVNLLATLISTVLYFLERYSLRAEMKFQKLLTLKAIYLFLIVVIPGSVLFYFTNNFKMIYLTDLCVTGIALAIGRITFLYFKKINELLIYKKDAELSKLKEVNTQIEIQSLHARINPHFLYNSLNSIAGLAHSNPDKTEKMALSLSDMFRYSLNRKNEVLADINDEVEMVRSYLEIEQIRFGERMSFLIEMDDELKTKQIPKFILQPLVENAIKHGISKIEGKGEISLSIKNINQRIEIEVSDNGPDFPKGLVAGYGLQSLYDLLKICYKDDAEVNWQNSPSKMISVKIPLNNKTV